jgi:hypothetical protein
MGDGLWVVCCGLLVLGSGLWVVGCGFFGFWIWNFLICPRWQWKAFLYKILFFVVLKMRPAEALFGAFKKSVFCKNLEMYSWK